MKFALVPLKGSERQIQQAHPVRQAFISDMKDLLIALIREHENGDAEHKKKVFETLFTVMIIAINDYNQALWWLQTPLKKRANDIVGKFLETYEMLQLSLTTNKQSKN